LVVSSVPEYQSGRLAEASLSRPLTSASFDLLQHGVSRHAVDILLNLSEVSL
jgi:hypothetical protein